MFIKFSLQRQEYLHWGVGLLLVVLLTAVYISFSCAVKCEPSTEEAEGLLLTFPGFAVLHRGAGLKRTPAFFKNNIFLSTKAESVSYNSCDTSAQTAREKRAYGCKASVIWELLQCCTHGHCSFPCFMT